jgi:hypothetical protein
MDIRIIKNPSQGTIEILKRRADFSKFDINIDKVSAVGLVQGKMIDMVVASDIAEKATQVTTLDIKGQCPQNMILLAIFGDTASVSTAIEDIKKGVPSGYC